MLTTERTRERVAAQVGTGLAQVVDAEAAVAAGWVFLATRLALVVIGLAAPALFSDHATRTPPLPTGSGWARWDTLWFVGIAEHGFSWSPVPGHYSATAFFPLYPLLIRLVGLSGLEPAAAATLIANAAFLGALYYLYRLVRLDWPAPVAGRALWLLALFPTALAFFIPYTESLYLFLAVLTFWHLRHRRWLAAGIAGALGALTRQSGLVLLLPYLVEWEAGRWWAAVGWPRAIPALPFSDGTLGASAAGVTARRPRAYPGLRALLPAALMPLAVALHLAYLWHVTGSPVAFLKAQGAWHRRADWPWSGIVATIQRWTWSPQAPHPATTAVQHVHMALELGTVVLFLALLVAGARRLRRSYTIYAGAVWLAALVSPAVADGFQNPLMSSSRFALSVFPSFIMLALALRRPGAYQSWLAASAMALGFLGAFFSVGGWVA